MEDRVPGGAKMAGEMKVRVVLTVEVDPEKWAKEYGTPAPEVREDVRNYARLMVLDSYAGSAGLIRSVESR